MICESRLAREYILLFLQPEHRVFVVSFEYSFAFFNAEYFITFLLKCRFIFMLKGYSRWLIYLLIRYIFILCKENKIYHNLFLKDIISCNIYFKSFHRISNNDKRIGSSRWYLSDNRGTIPIFIWSIISTLLTTVSH